ncbi:hypothetical protein BDW60DRAFT_194018 [Aspergillus nidulans var. acristatus]
MVMAGELVTKNMHMLLRPYDERYWLHQRMEAPLLTLRAASNYRPLQDVESRQLLFDVLREWDEHGEILAGRPPTIREPNETRRMSP